MNRVIVNIGKSTYRCEVAETPEEFRMGLSHRDFLPKDEGMLFDFSIMGRIPEMYMKDTTIPLDMIGIDDEGEVVQIERPKTGSTELIAFPDSVIILEVNAGSKVKIGDDFEIDDSEDLDKYVMKVLAPDGSTQIMLRGGERIFSRISTKIIVSRAKKAYKSRNNKELYEKECKRLGKYVLKELKAQEERKPEYVSVPNSN